PGKGTQGFSDFLRLGRAGFSAAGGIQQLLLLEVVVATDDGQRQLPVDDVDQRLELTLGVGDARVGFGEGGDGAYPRRGETLAGLCLVTVVYLRDAGHCFLQVGRIVAVGAGDDPVLARVAPNHELD